MTGTYTIAVDFDGTIVEDEYPKIGKPIIFAFDTLKKLQENGHRLILWTYRKGKALDEAVDFCKQNGIVFYAVNKSFPEEEFDPSYSRKINADYFIDDRNIGGLVGWGETYRLLIGEEQIQTKKPKKKGWFPF
ncbi:BT0820 family HAD-type phosphatase [Patiriisocius hiemis]|uniref:Hydrolase n=1 Tax=Patiriisocius hiemis TaxID=3075604 RepID=A0ABU2YEB8_9FLAO|nr:hydrolase [Constantimarinum sp. W242]MDT0556531.1 hydrolase [Constantimarinum sp. W242]